MSALARPAGPRPQHANLNRDTYRRLQQGSGLLIAPARLPLRRPLRIALLFAPCPACPLPSTMLSALLSLLQHHHIALCPHAVSVSLSLSLLALLMAEYLALAQAGDPWAMFNLGHSYYRGDDGVARDAAKALGLNQIKTFTLIVLPQAMRVIVPALGNSINGLLKTTSIASVISMEELLRRGQILMQQKFEVLEVFICVAIIYLAMTTVWEMIQSKIEAHYGKAYAERTTEKSTLVRDNH